ncbi:MAG: hypothetical protein ACOYJ2_04610 [Rickettsiales bacterium]
MVDFINDGSDANTTVSNDDLVQRQARRIGTSRRDWQYTTIGDLGRNARYNEVITPEEYDGFVQAWLVANAAEAARLTPDAQGRVNLASNDKFRTDFETFARREEVKDSVAYFRELLNKEMLPTEYRYLRNNNRDENYTTRAEALAGLSRHQTVDRIAELERQQAIIQNESTSAADKRRAEARFRAIVDELSVASVAHLNGIEATVTECEAGSNQWMLHYNVAKDSQYRIPTDTTPFIDTISSCHNGTCTLDYTLLRRIAAPVIPDAVAQTNVILPAQFIPTAGGAENMRRGQQFFDFHYGRPPQDAAAEQSMRRARDRGDAIRPTDSEGALTDTRRAGGTGQTQSNDAQMRRYSSGTAREEIEHEPKLVVFTNQYGEQIGISNPAFDDKMEQTTRWEVTPSGEITTVREGSAVISINRRRDPDHRGIFTNVDTARNVINQYSSSDEGLEVIARLVAVEEYRNPLMERFEATTADPTITAVDAERALQLNVQLALNPVFWSEDRGGVPLGEFRQIQDDMLAVFDSPSFANLPLADRERLTARFRPMINLIGQHERLERAVDALPAPATHLYGEVDSRLLPELDSRRFIGPNANGRYGLFDPLVDSTIHPHPMGEARSEINYIANNYYHRPRTEQDPHPNRNVNLDERELRSAIYALGGAYAAREAGFRAPDTTEYRVAMAAGPTTEVRERDQRPEVLMAQQREFVRQLRTNPTLRDQWIDYVLSNPGAFDNISGLMMDATRDTPANLGMMNFRNRGEAVDNIRDIAEGMAGEDYRERVEYRERGFMEMAFGGLPLVGGLFQDRNRNQLQRFEGFRESAQARFEGGGANREAVIAAFDDVLERVEQSYDGSQRDTVGLDAVIDTVDPNDAEDINRTDDGRGFRTGEAHPDFVAMTRTYQPLEALAWNRFGLDLRARNNTFGEIEVNADGGNGRGGAAARLEVDNGQVNNLITATVRGAALPAITGLPTVTSNPTAAKDLFARVTSVPNRQSTLALFAQTPALADAVLQQFALTSAGEAAILAAIRANASSMTGDVASSLVTLNATGGDTAINRRAVVRAFVDQPAGPAHTAILTAISADEGTANAAYEAILTNNQLMHFALRNYVQPADAPLLARATGLPLSGADSIGESVRAAGLFNVVQISTLSATGTVVRADNPSASQSEVNSAIARQMSSADPAMFSMMLISQLAARSGTPEGRRHIAAMVQEMNEAGGDSARYARLLAGSVRALNAAETPEALRAAQANMVTQVNAFFAGSGDDAGEIAASAQSRALLAANLGGNIAVSGEASELLAASYAQLRANPRAAIDALLADGSINAAQADQLNAAISQLLSLRASGDPDAFNAWSAQFIGQNTDALHARFGVNPIDLLWLGGAVVGFSYETRSWIELIRRAIDPTKWADLDGVGETPDPGDLFETVEVRHETSSWEFDEVRAAGGVLVGGFLRQVLRGDGQRDSRNREDLGGLAGAVTPDDDDNNNDLDPVAFSAPPPPRGDDGKAQGAHGAPKT